MYKIIKKKNDLGKVIIILLCIILGIYTISLFIPMVWGMATSFKSKIEYRTNMLGFPKEWMFSNYKTVIDNFNIEVEYGASFRYVNIGEMIWYTLAYAIGCSAVSVIIAGITAYAAARFKYKFSKIIYNTVIITMILPIVGSLPAELQLAKTLNIWDTITGMYIMKTYFSGIYFLVFYSAFAVLPKDYAEAAYVDGANNFTVMFKIMFPFVRNLFSTVFLLKFISFWNDYQTPMLFMPSKPTLAYGLYYYANVSCINSIKNVPMQLAGCMMMAFPIILLFVVFNKKLIGNLSISGIKE